MSKVKEVNGSNCYNDSRIQITSVFTTESLTASTNAVSVLKTPKVMGAVSVIIALTSVWLSL